MSPQTTVHCEPQHIVLKFINIDQQKKTGSRPQKEAVTACHAPSSMRHYFIVMDLGVNFIHSQV
nr:hypothetical protein [uncultured Desulfobulbus sp.]